MLSDVDQAKRALRALLHPAASVAGDVDGMIAQVLAVPLPTGCRIAGVWPLPGEPDLVPAWTGLHERGHTILLPETTPSGQALRFRYWRPGSVLVPGRYATLHPDGDVATPEIVFVPLLAWDLSLARLGRGGGYYDRTLATLVDAEAIGFGFERQRVVAVPIGPHDQRLHRMVTERRVLNREDRSA